MKIINLDFFSGKIVTSLAAKTVAGIFTMEKSLFKMIFGRTFIREPIFKLFVGHILQLLECKMVTWSYFS